MNIAVNCRLLQKGKLEGIGWFMFETLKRITTQHPEHQFFFIFDRDFDQDFIFADNVKPIVLRPATRHPVLWFLWFEFRIPALLKKLKADLFFSPDGYLSLRTKTPQIPVIHDINFVHRPKDLPFFTRSYYNYYFPRFAKIAKRICTVSKYSKRDLNQSYKIANPLIHVVYNGANEAYKPLNSGQKDAGRQKYAGGSEYFIFIGSIHPRKNLDSLIQAFTKFKEKTNSDIKLLVVGTQMWREKGQKAVPDSVIFAGRLEAEELQEALGSALALTFVPWFEGFGIPVLEAMYAGVPVLTSTETSLPEVGGDAVLYAHPGSIDEISDKLEVLAENHELREKLINAGNEQMKKFSWDQTAANVWSCLSTVIFGIERKNGQHS